jgi:hypothetical protein
MAKTLDIEISDVAHRNATRTFTNGRSEAHLSIDGFCTIVHRDGGLWCFTNDGNGNRVSVDIPAHAIRAAIGDTVFAAWQAQAQNDADQ